MPKIASEDARAVHTDIEQFIYRSWWNIDHDGGVDGAAFFCADGVLTMPAGTMRGRGEIAQGYGARQARGPRLSRHLVNNLVIETTAPDRASVLYALLVYAKAGVQPLSPSAYQAVCDVHDQVVLNGGRWLLQRRDLTAVFIAPDNDSVLLIPSTGLPLPEPGRV